MELRTFVVQIASKETTKVLATPSQLADAVRNFIVDTTFVEHTEVDVEVTELAEPLLKRTKW